MSKSHQRELTTRLRRAAARVIAGLAQPKADADFSGQIHQLETYELLVMLMMMSEELGEHAGQDNPTLWFGPDDRAAVLAELDRRIIDGRQIVSRKIS